MANPTEEMTQATLATTTELREPIVVASSSAPARSGACRECLQKHLLKAEGYAEEMREDPSRAWEKKQLLKNLMLAEDHALALGDEDARAAIRAARLAAEGGAFAAASALYDALFDASCGCRKKTTEHTENTEKVSVPSVSSVVEEKGGEF
jgi:riboflavin biosynthesis pyrimidine reductase